MNAIDFSQLLNTDAKLEDVDWPCIVPDVLPPSMLDLDRAKGCMEMAQPMQDACPACGGFCMQVGDYVCYGTCTHCVDEVMDEA